MLKDITLGQYFPGHSVLHRLDPRTKLIGVVVYIIALFLCTQLLSYGVVALFLAWMIHTSGVGMKAMVRGLRPVLVIMIFTGVLNLFYTGGTPLIEIGFVTITVEGVWRAFFMVARIMMLIMGTFLLTYTTSPIMLTDAIESVLGPLKKLHLPIHELAMIMSIALRFVPTLIEETDKLMSAQKARGADFESGNLIEKAKALVPLLVPLFVSAFRRAEELAVAMESRCYHGGEGRTRLRQLKYERRDYIAMLVLALLVIVVVILRTFGL